MIQVSDLAAFISNIFGTVILPKMPEVYTIN